MVGIEIFEKFTKIPQVNYIGVEDLSDRVNYKATVVLLLAFCTITTLKTYILTPVACYIPNEVGAHTGQEQFVNNFCWTEGTYAVPLSEFKLDNHLEDPAAPYADRKMLYYQWVPFMLGLQALLFYMPLVVWRWLSYTSAGTDVGHVIKTANDAVEAEGEKYEKLIRHVCRRVSDMLKVQERQQETNAEVTRRSRLKRQLCQIRHRLTSHGTDKWLIGAYLLVKLLSALNAFGQLALMHTFLGFGASYWAFGASVLTDIARGKDWTRTMIFPRVGCCAVYYRTANRGNWVFSQCTLPINMINEKIYIFLWFWILGAGIFTLLSLPMWLLRMFRKKNNISFVKSLLLLSELSEFDSRSCVRFCKNHLRFDGIFLLRMIAINCGEVVTVEVIRRLWEEYQSSITGRKMTLLPQKDENEDEKEKEKEKENENENENEEETGAAKATPVSGDFSIERQPDALEGEENPRAGSQEQSARKGSFAVGRRLNSLIRRQMSVPAAQTDGARPCK